MKQLLLVACMVGLGLVAAPAGAETAQQQKMKDCNAQATAQKMSGEDRKTFMSQCLKATAAAPAAPQLTAQQQKMKDCNSEAAQKQLKGKDRKTFMSNCLSGPH